MRKRLRIIDIEQQIRICRTKVGRQWAVTSRKISVSASALEALDSDQKAHLFCSKKDGTLIEP